MFIEKRAVMAIGKYRMLIIDCNRQMGAYGIFFANGERTFKEKLILMR
jgi:hypothetical protein